MKSIYKVLVALAVASAFQGCSKEDKLNYKIENPDAFTPGPLDNWISTNLTDPYNIEVIYRYQRNMHDVNKNISPPEESKVQPQMQIVIDGFLDVYKDVAGATFMKTYTPKQFALFGSGNYETDGSVVAGTADGGRRVTLYGLNNLNINNPASVMGNLGTIHHEFVHILNQTRVIPEDFLLITIGDYYANWTNTTQNSVQISRDLGFISPYARKNVGEDFAEVMSTLITDGQLYYDFYAVNSSETGRARLKAKEAVVRDYVQRNFGMELIDVQRQFQKTMEEKYGVSDFKLYTAISRGQVKSINLDTRQAWGQARGQSEKQRSVTAGILDGVGGYPVRGLNLRFVSSTKATLDVLFASDATTTSFWTASYDFTIGTSNGDYTINLSPTQGTGQAYDYAKFSYIASDVKPLIDFLASTTFQFDFIAGDADPNLLENYKKYGGIRDVNNSANTIYGQLNFK